MTSDEMGYLPPKIETKERIHKTVSDRCPFTYDGGEQRSEKVPWILTSLEKTASQTRSPHFEIREFFLFFWIFSKFHGKLLRVSECHSP